MTRSLDNIFHFAKAPQQERGLTPEESVFLSSACQLADQSILESHHKMWESRPEVLKAAIQEFNAARPINQPLVEQKAPPVTNVIALTEQASHLDSTRQAVHNIYAEYEQGDYLDQISA